MLFQFYFPLYKKVVDNCGQLAKSLDFIGLNLSTNSILICGQLWTVVDSF